MKRDAVTRKLAATLLISIAGVMVLAIAQMLFDVKLDDAVRRGADLIGVGSDTYVVERPVRLGAASGVVLTAGTVASAKAADGERKIVTLSTPVFEISVTPPEGAVREAQSSFVAPLIEALMAGDAAKAVIKHGIVLFRSGDGSAVQLSDVDVEVSLKSKTTYAAKGQFTYLGQIVGFDASGSVRDSVWPVRIALNAPLLTVVTDGVLETAAGWTYVGETEVRAADTSKLAAWLGYGWTSSEAGPAALVKGPLTWSRGAISFGKSKISLGDQSGVGAVVVSFRESRPLIEASVGFPALDAAPLLYRKCKGAPQPSQTLAPALQQPIWRCLATSFAAAKAIDIDFRISATRLQWRGEPIGKGALSVAARGGAIHADFSELDLGAYAGNVQVTLDENARNKPVALRGRFQAKDVASIAASVFGAPLLRGAGNGQFELSGSGPTLGEVVDGATGRGSLEVRDGQLQLDLPAVQRLVASVPAMAAVDGWAPVAGTTAFETLSAKFQVREGAAIIDEANVRSRGLIGALNGRIGIAASDLDVRIKVGPAERDGDGKTPAAKVTPTATRAQVRAAGDVLSIQGPWTAPALSIVSTGPLP